MLEWTLEFDGRRHKVRRKSVAGDGPGMWAVIKRSNTEWDSHTSVTTVGLFDTEAKADEYIAGWMLANDEGKLSENSDSPIYVSLEKEWMPVKEKAPSAFHVIYMTDTAYEVATGFREIENQTYMVMDSQQLADTMRSLPEYRVAFENQNKAIEVISNPSGDIVFSENAPKRCIDGKIFDSDGDELHYVYQNWISFNPNALKVQPTK